MEIEYASEEVKNQCTNIKTAQKLFGGDKALAEKLLSRINAIQAADTIKDIILQRPFRFHKLDNKGRKSLDGFFAIDVKSVREPWRLVLRPLDSDGEPYNPCNIDEIADGVRVVEIMEVSKHYE